MEGRSSAAPQVWQVDFNLPSSMPCASGRDSTEARRDQAPQASVWLLAAGQQFFLSAASNKTVERLHRESFDRDGSPSQ